MNKILKKIIVASFISFAIFFNFSCASTSLSEKVEPVEVLSADSDAYFSIPVQSNFEFSKKLVSTFLTKDDGVSEKDVVSILKRIDVLYAGTKLQTNYIEISASGNFPTTLSKLILTEKNGWKKNKFKNQTYYEFSPSKVDLTFINSDLACISLNKSGMEKMLSKYNSILTSENPEKIQFDTSEKDISFFFPNTKVILKMLGFDGIDFNSIESVSGKFVQMPAGEFFNSEFSLKLVDPKMRKAVSAILRLCLLGSDANVSYDETSVIIKGLIVSWDSVFELVDANSLL